MYTDGTKVDVLSLVLAGEKDLQSLLRIFRENLIYDPDFIDVCYFHVETSGSNFIQKVFNLKSSKEKIEVCEELLKIQKSGEVNSSEILDHFRVYLE